MSQITAFADEDTRRAVRALSADVQASIALNRALLQAISGLSPALGEAAEQALAYEVDQAREMAAPQRTVELIQSVHNRVQEAPEEAEMMARLERALIAAADALPDIHDLTAADAASQAHG